MRSVASLLQEVEHEYRNTYWVIRNSRSTNWKAVNRVRVLSEILRRCGVPEQLLVQGRYCLKQLTCRRCSGDVDGLKCHAFAARIERGDC